MMGWFRPLTKEKLLEWKAGGHIIAYVILPRNLRVSPTPPYSLNIAQMCEAARKAVC